MSSTNEQYRFFYLVSSKIKVVITRDRGDSVIDEGLEEPVWGSVDELMM